MNTHTLSVSRRILITGASRGIGRETALLLARNGHRVVPLARDAAALEALVADIGASGGDAEAVPVDITDWPSVDRAMCGVLARGPVDVLVNNAGWCDQREWRLQHLDTQRAEMALNYWGAVHVSGQPRPLRRRRPPRRPGTSAPNGPARALLASVERMYAAETGSSTSVLSVSPTRHVRTDEEGGRRRDDE